MLRLLDYPGYFELLKKPLPDGHSAILSELESDDIIAKCSAGGYNITNLVRFYLPGILMIFQS